MPSDGWAARVSVSAARCAARSSSDAGGRREHQLREPATAREEALQSREGDEQVAEHADALAALAGEEECDLAGLLGELVVADEDAAPLGRERSRRLELRPQVVEIARDHGDLHGLVAGRHRAGEVAEPPGLVAREEPLEELDARRRLVPRGAAEQEQLGRPLARAADSASPCVGRGRRGSSCRRSRTR